MAPGRREGRSANPGHHGGAGLNPATTYRPQRSHRHRKSTRQQHQMHHRILDREEPDYCNRKLNRRHQRHQQPSPRLCKFGHRRRHQRAEVCHRISLIAQIHCQRADGRGGPVLAAKAEALHPNAEIHALVAERHPDVAVQDRDRGGPVQRTGPPGGRDPTASIGCLGRGVQGQLGDASGGSLARTSGTDEEAPHQWQRHKVRSRRSLRRQRRNLRQQDRSQNPRHRRRQHQEHRRRPQDSHLSRSQTRRRQRLRQRQKTGQRLPAEGFSYGLQVQSAARRSPRRAPCPFGCTTG